MATRLDRDGVLALVAGDPWMMAAIEAVRSLELPDAWVAAGFVRGRVWDHLHGYAERTPPGDLDVIFFDPGRPPADDRRLEAELERRAPAYPWEVYNQAHTHRFNGDRPYSSSADALSRWAETASTVAVRLGPAGRLELLAPCGIADLVGMVIRFNPHPDARRDVFDERLRCKGWQRRWPRVRVAR
ncbi:MAG: nucleotidyltransferase family protein [Acidobacteria bacterium]|nr:MAG: nucleotidyltransferase family protein [Acidobacteriota bacterium]